MKANARQYAESLTTAYEAGEKSPRELINGLMAVLSKKQEGRLAKKILAHLIEKEAEGKGVVEAVIETAHPVTAAAKKLLVAKAETLYPGKKIHTEFRVQPELVAGFRIRGKDRELDQSFTTGLKNLRNQLTRF